MTVENNHFAHTAMLIRKPVAEVFEAIINPDITTQFWFTKGSARLEEGKSVDWTWEMYNHTLTVHVLKLVENETILIQWGDDKDSTVLWTFQNLGENKTFVSIVNKGFKGTTEELIAKISDSTGGFTWMLAGLKAYLEHNIKLNLVADRYPKELNEK